MKKNRPGVLLTVLCAPELSAKMEKIIFRETGTLGIRSWPVARHKLERREHAVETAHGTILGKIAVLTDGSLSFSPEFEACRKIAELKQIPLREIYDAAMQAYTCLLAVATQTALVCTTELLGT
jgi:pyridinium-3,5-bisthiocarboxylic acid mononucleotide nickel chelatase